jgi:hypothetical protein
MVLLFTIKQHPAATTHHDKKEATSRILKLMDYKFFNLLIKLCSQCSKNNRNQKKLDLI